MHNTFSFRATGVLTLLATLALSACATLPSPNERGLHADALASAAGLSRSETHVDGFVLTSFVRISQHDQPLTIYIEGDGFAFRTRSQPSDDPTPIKPTGLSLAAADRSANVVYLARPCQFAQRAENPRCTVSYWTDRRFAEEPVNAMNQAVELYARQVPGQRLQLVGYSGGAAIAVLLAARRTDVSRLLTVAGNLDVAEFNRLHKATPMPASLDPIASAPALGSLPQIHYYGTADHVVPGSIAKGFVRASASVCAQARAVDGMTHDGDWAARWPAMLTAPAGCQEKR